MSRCEVSVPRSSFAHAIEAAQLGASVIPVAIGADGGKRPLVRWRRWQEEAASEAQLRDWSRTFGDRITAWGLITGAQSGLIALDFDTPATPEALDWVRRIGELPHTWTPSGGAHLLVRHPGRKIRSRVGVVPGVDVRGDGGYAVLCGRGPKGAYQRRRPLSEAVEWDALPEDIREALERGGDECTSSGPQAGSSTTAGHNAGLRALWEASDFDLEATCRAQGRNRAVWTALYREHRRGRLRLARLRRGEIVRRANAATGGRDTQGAVATFSVVEFDRALGQVSSYACEGIDNALDRGRRALLRAPMSPRARAVVEALLEICAAAGRTEFDASYRRLARATGIDFADVHRVVRAELKGRVVFAVGDGRYGTTWTFAKPQQVETEGSRVRTCADDTTSSSTHTNNLPSVGAGTAELVCWTSLGARSVPRKARLRGPPGNSRRLK